jgi:hypothetical protein
MLTAGVDLAAEPRGTALAILEWLPEKVVLRELRVNVADDVIVDAALKVEKIGVDCALGCPQEFVNFVNSQANLNAHNDFDGGMEWRRRLAYRETDRQVRATTGRWPLSVSTDRLGLTAMRAAGLISKLAKQGLEVERTGKGLIAEVYPGASLRLWGFDTAGYRASSEGREKLLAAIKSSLPEFEAGKYAQLMISSCDAFDAVVAAFAARAVTMRKTLGPASDQLELARLEGWIHLPQDTLSSLFG